MNQSETGCAARLDQATAWAQANSATPMLVVRFGSLLLAIIITVVVFQLREAVALHAGLGYGGVFLFMLVTNATLILPAPAWVLVFAVGAALNPVSLALVAGVGAALGETTGYLAGFAGRGTLESHAWYGRVEGFMEQYGGWVLVVLGAIPNPFFDLGGMAAGVLRMPLWKFLLATTMGKSLRFLMIALLGASLG